MSAPVYIEVNAFKKMLRDEGLMIVPTKLANEVVVDGQSLEGYRKRVLKQAMLTVTEISKARIWGNVGVGRVKQIAKEVGLHDNGQMILRGGTYKIPRAAVRNIAVARGFAFNEK